MKILKSIARSLSLFFLCTACLSPSGSRLQHQDVPGERGADQPEPWHFHTGEGVRFEEFLDEKTGKLVQTSTNCDLLAEDAEALGCKERVHFFAKSDIDLIVKATTDVMNAAVEKYGAQATATAAIAAATLVGSGVLVATPEPGLSKAGAAAVYAISAGFATYSAYQFSKAAYVSSELIAVGTLLEDEARFAIKCGHIRKDFLENAATKGITFNFPRNGGQFISARHYQESFKQERALYKKVADLALTERIPTYKAYSKYFRNECGQLPIVNISESDRAFVSAGNLIPMDIKAQALRLDESLDLVSKQSIVFSNFNAGDVYSDDQKNSLSQSILRWRVDIERIKQFGSADDKMRLEEMRLKVHQIYIQTKAQTWTTFGGKRIPYELVQREGKTYLLINAIRMGSFYPLYDMSHFEAMTEGFKFNPKSLSRN